MKKAVVTSFWSLSFWFVFMTCVNNGMIMCVGSKSVSELTAIYNIMYCQFLRVCMCAYEREVGEVEGDWEGGREGGRERY